MIWLDGLLAAEKLEVSLSHRLVHQQRILGYLIILQSMVHINARGPLPPFYHAYIHGVKGLAWTHVTSSQPLRIHHMAKGSPTEDSLHPFFR